MAVTISLIFFVIAAILFLISAASIPTGRLGLQSLGLFFLALAEIFR